MNQQNELDYLIETLWMAIEQEDDLMVDYWLRQIDQEVYNTSHSQ